MLEPQHYLAEGRALLLRHRRTDGLSTSVLPGIHLMRFGWPSLPLVNIQTPCMALVLQGMKTVSFAGGELRYRAGQYALAAIDVPATSCIAEGSSEEPLLSVGIDLSVAELREVAGRCEHLPAVGSTRGLEVFDADAGLLESVVRLLRLLDTPQHRKPLGPLLRQEVLYRLLAGPGGPRLLEICRHGSPASRVSEVTSWIRRNYAEGLRIAELAHIAGMSSSSFHQHFKLITGMTPVQYQRSVRLQEGRRSLFLDNLDVSEASLRAGYHSASQFSKDYREYFGRLPKADVLAYHRGEGAAIHSYSPSREAYSPVRPG